MSINRMGADDSAERPRLNRAIRAQLEEIAGEALGYISGEEMPHEWGSLDSFDDMRNSLAVGLALMDNLLMSPDSEDDVIKAAIVDRGLCATAEGVWAELWPDSGLDYEAKVEKLSNDMIDELAAAERVAEQLAKDKRKEGRS